MCCAEPTRSAYGPPAGKIGGTAGVKKGGEREDLNSARDG
jgi:hypothetical protein